MFFFEATTSVWGFDLVVDGKWGFPLHTLSKPSMKTHMDQTNGIPFWLGLVNSPPILEPIFGGG